MDAENEKLKTVQELQTLISYYNKELKDDLEENVKAYYILRIKMLESDLEPVQTIEHYKGNYRKVAKTMKALYDLDEEATDEDFSILRKKTHNLLDKEELKINLKIKALEKELKQVAFFKGIMSYTPVDLWFYDLVKETKELIEK